MPTIYTLSYQSEGARAALEQYVPPLAVQTASGANPTACIFDIRQSLHHAELPFWRKENLVRHFGTAGYQYLQSLRNDNDREPGKPVRMRDFEVGLYACRGSLREQDIVLLCWCPPWRPCHRLEVADALFASLRHLCPELRVVHLLDPPRPNPAGALPVMVS